MTRHLTLFTVLAALALSLAASTASAQTGGDDALTKSRLTVIGWVVSYSYWQTTPPREITGGRFVENPDRQAARAAVEQWAEDLGLVGFEITDLRPRYAPIVAANPDLRRRNPLDGMQIRARIQIED